MIKITKEEKKLIKYALIISACVVLFSVLFYIPKSIALTKLKSKVEKNDALIAEIKRKIGGHASLQEGVSILRKEAGILSSKYVEQSDISLSLNRLSEAAVLAGVRIDSMTPQNFSNSGSAKYNGKSCLKQQVRLVLYGRYEQLVNYMHLLEHSQVGIFTIESFSISIDKKISPDLRMELTVGLYVFGEEKQARNI